MSTPYPPTPRRLMRDPSHKLIGGVCSGLAKYLNMDVNLVRILTVLISLFTGVPIVLYIIALFVLPEERPEQQPPYVNGPQPGAYDSGFTAQGYASTQARPAESAYGQPAYGQSAPGQSAPGQQAYGQPAYSQPTPPPANDVWGPEGAPWEQPQAAAASAPSDPTVAPEQESSSEPTSYDTAPVEPDTAADTAAAEPETGSVESDTPAVQPDAATAESSADSGSTGDEESKRES